MLMSLQFVTSAVVRSMGVRMCTATDPPAAKHTPDLPENTARPHPLGDATGLFLTVTPPVTSDLTGRPSEGYFSALSRHLFNQGQSIRVSER